jgi:hypothetical protein
MTAPRPAAPEENVISGGLFALLALPVGVVVVTLLSSIGFVASIVGYLVAIAAVWLYRRGSGGAISRVGAWTVTGIVVLTLLIGIWLSMVVTFAGGLGKLSNIGIPQFWTQFGEAFPANVNSNILFIALVLVFGLLGAFRTLGRAFAVARQTPGPVGLTAQSSTLPAAPSTYHDDIDASPTGSADDRTAPPNTGN